ncbi:hypothetical protein [Streptomyces sp. NPDC050504]|uniref:hypothetical protein n=1 Tax=Streptomyces sp. NPDC050504 TaxID=3365618 RepID=UPI00379FD0BE
MYRRADDVDAEEHPERYTEQPVREAYCWANLTSGNGARALWLLLLPFMVANLSHWMRPPARRARRLKRLYGALVRLVALSLTVLLTAAACEVALDLVAWQCAGEPDCVADRSWLGFLSPEQGGWWSQPGRRVALAALVPTALVGLLWYLSNRTWSAYESQRPLDVTAVADDAADDTTGGNESTDAADGAADTDDDDADEARPRFHAALARPGFWYGRRLVARLRAAHTAAGFLTVAAALVGAAAGRDRDTGAMGEAPGLVLTAALVLGSLTVLWVVCRRGRGERRADYELERALVTWLPGAALGVLAASAVYAAWSRPGWESHGALPGDVTFRVVAVAQCALVVGLGAVALALYRRTPRSSTPLYGLGGPAVAMLACALGGVMSGGVAQRVADWLDGPGTPGMDDRGRIPGPPVLLSWQASVIPVLLVLLLAPLTYLVVRTLREARRTGPGIEAEYAVRKPDEVRTRRISRMRAAARLTDSAPRLVGLVSATTLLLGTFAIVGAWATGEVPGRAAAGTSPFVESVADSAQALGSWLIGFGFILFVALGRRAYRDPAARRTIGILWDVGTFWPRAAHPFAPPCYAERAVPDLAWRMAGWTGLTGGRLVISGHSQGSVLAAAAVWQLPAAIRRRVALLTYGSPLERLYGRWFPAYFGPTPLGALHESVDCWRNLWRRTDPIGGPVGLDGVDRDALADPVAYDRDPAHPLPAPVLGHSEYQTDPAFPVERAALLDRLPPAAVPRQKTSPDGQRVQGSSGRS